jgi:hypothetical protein
MKTIKQKIEVNNLTITKAVILKTKDCNKKIDKFIKGNKFTKLTCDIMNTLQKKSSN